jgi:hypothetical protein
MDAGSHSYQLSTQTLPVGRYHLRVQAGDFAAVKPLMVIR